MPRSYCKQRNMTNITTLVAKSGISGPFVSVSALERFAALVAAEAVAQERERWASAFVEARDNVLHDRGPLADADMDAYRTNAVLSVLDDAFAGLC